jgi:hypothetical protein
VSLYQISLYRSGVTFRGTNPTRRRTEKTEDEYYAGKFTDAELNCQADIADYRKAVEEFFLEHQYQMDE